MDRYKDKYIRLIESYLGDREGSRKHVTEAMDLLLKECSNPPEGIEVLVMKRRSDVSMLPGGSVRAPSDPVFSTVIDLETIQNQIQKEYEKRKDLINCFALILVLFRKIDTSFLLLDGTTKDMMSRVYFDKSKSYLLKKEFCYGQKKIDRIIREGLERIYESVHSVTFDHAVNTIQRS